MVGSFNFLCFWQIHMWNKQLASRHEYLCLVSFATEHWTSWLLCLLTWDPLLNFTSLSKHRAQNSAFLDFLNFSIVVKDMKIGHPVTQSERCLSYNWAGGFCSFTKRSHILHSPNLSGFLKMVMPLTSPRFALEGFPFFFVGSLGGLGGCSAQVLALNLITLPFSVSRAALIPVSFDLSSPATKSKALRSSLSENLLMTLLITAELKTVLCRLPCTSPSDIISLNSTKNVASHTAWAP